MKDCERGIPLLPIYPHLIQATRLVKRPIKFAVNGDSEIRQTCNITFKESNPALFRRNSLRCLFEVTASSLLITGSTRARGKIDQLFAFFMTRDDSTHDAAFRSMVMDLIELISESNFVSTPCADAKVLIAAII